MDISKYRHWSTALKSGKKRPAYLLIPDLISDDIDNEVLIPRERLPTVRDLASFLSLDYTTVARAYKEARHQGLIESHPRSGSYVKGSMRSLKLRDGSDFEMTMNLPPEPESIKLALKINNAIKCLSNKHDVKSMFRYQDFGGSDYAKKAGVEFISKVIDKPNEDQLLVCPGIHSALVGLLSMLAGQGGTVCVQSLVYPGLKAIAAQLDIKLISIDSDSEGPIIYKLEALYQTEKISALYVNPTLQNPTTETISLKRRKQIAKLAMHYSVPIIEDDPYAFLPEVPVLPIYNFAPQLTYYITGLSKCFGAGLRTAYLYTPSNSINKKVAGALRSLMVMASPITDTLSTDWINDGTVDEAITAIRKETRIRQAFAHKYLADFIIYSDKDVFHLWVRIPSKVEMNPSVLATHLRDHGVNAVSSAAFCTDNNPPHALRIGLGGALTRSECVESLKLVAKIFENPLHLTNVIL